MTETVQRLIRVTKEQDDTLRLLAFEKRVSVAEVIRQIVEQHLKEEKKRK